MMKEKSMVGRMFDENKQDLGDAKFWERDMGLTPQEETEFLDKKARELADAALLKTQDLVQQHPELKAKLYGELVALYPDDPRAQEWKKMTE